MNMRRKLTTSVVLCLALSSYSYATVNIGGKTHAKSTHSVMASGCTQDLGAATLQINNIRCRIMDEGDMWWNPGTGYNVYFAPANGIVSAQFAGALWIGGYDAGSQLKEAAMTYRQNGEDFLAGPIDTVTGGISISDCQLWDRLFYCTEKEVADYHTKYPHGTSAAILKSNYPDIYNWPGGSGGNVGFSAEIPTYESQFLAPYVSVSGSGYYNPTAGDYPAFDLSG